MHKQITSEMTRNRQLLEEFFKEADINDFIDTDDIEDEIEENNLDESLTDIVGHDDEEIEMIYKAIQSQLKPVDDNKLFTLFENRIDVKKLLSDKNFITKYRYMRLHSNKIKFINDTLKTLLKNVKITDDEYIILYDNISNRLRQYSEDYFSKLKIEAEKLPTEKVFNFLFDNALDYLKFMKSKNLDVTNKSLVVYKLCKYYPSNIRSLFSQHVQDIYNIYERKRIEELNAYKSQNITIDIDTKMKELLLYHYAYRVIELYQNNTSFAKIQKILTRELIDSNELPPTIKRYDRSSSVEKVLIERPTSLPMRVIKKIIKDANVKISKVGRYSTAS